MFLFVVEAVESETILGILVVDFEWFAAYSAIYVAVDATHAPIFV